MKRDTGRALKKADALVAEALKYNHFGLYQSAEILLARARKLRAAAAKRK